MKIEHPYGINTQNPYKIQPAQTESINKGKEKDKLEISQASREALALQEATKARREYIAKLKEQVQAGTYKIDASALAEKILSNGLI